MKKNKYIESTLSKDENILAVAELPWISYITPAAIFLFAFIALFSSFALFIIIGAIGLLVLMRLLAVEMVCTNKRVILKKGFLLPHTEEIRIEKIEFVSMGGDMGDCGTLIFGGTGATKVIFNVKNPKQTKVEFEEVIERLHRKK